MRARHGEGTTLQVLGAVALFTLALGSFGPALDADPYGTPLPDPAPPTAEERLRADAAAHCRQPGGENAGYILTGRAGEFACTDKRGRRTSRVTVLHRAEAP